MPYWRRTRAGRHDKGRHKARRPGGNVSRSSLCKDGGFSAPLLRGVTWRAFILRACVDTASFLKGWWTWLRLLSTSGRLMSGTDRTRAFLRSRRYCLHCRAPRSAARRVRCNCALSPPTYYLPARAARRHCTRYARHTRTARSSLTLVATPLPLPLHHYTAAATFLLQRGVSLPAILADVTGTTVWVNKFRYSISSRCSC